MGTDSTTALLPVPVPAPKNQGGSGTAAQIAGAMRSKIVQASEGMNDPQWSLPEANIEGTVQSVERQRLWRHPLDRLTFSRADLQAAALDMQRRNAPEDMEPITVAYWQDPNVPAPRPGQSPRHDLVIVNADDALRYEAAPLAGIRILPVVVQRYTNFYELTRALVVPKLQQHVANDQEQGEMFVGMMVAHKIAKRMDPALPDFPKAAEWCATLNKSQPTISKWMSVGNASDDFVDHFLSGELTLAQSIELLPLDAVGRAELAADIISEEQTTGSPVSRDVVRERVKTRRQARGLGGKTRVSWRDATTMQHTIAPPSVDQLWLVGEGLDSGMSIQEMIARLTHDLRECIEVVVDKMPRHDPDVIALQKALRRPGILDHERHFADPNA